MLVRAHVAKNTYADSVRLMQVGRPLADPVADLENRA
jgi:hypothetical protein